MHRPDIRCPVCEQTQFETLPEYNGYQMYECEQCSFVFAIPRKIPDGIYESLYSGNGYKVMVESARTVAAGGDPAPHIAWFRQKALSWADGHTLLDVGSGAGTFLLAAKRRGWDVQGIELSSRAGEIARELGIPTHIGPIETFMAEPRFDCITMFEVLEHLIDPVEILGRLASMMVKGGKLILSVPNVRDPYMLKQPFAISMPPVHMNFFSSRSLTTALKRSGFDVERIETRPIPTATVRSLHGMKGLLLRVPYLLALKAIGKAEGTTLLARARWNG